MNTEKLQIVSIDRKTGVSSKNNRPYTLTNVQDGFSGRKAAAFGEWADNWKIGDEIEVVWVESGEYKGTKQWRVDSPTRQPRSAASSATATPAVSNSVIAYQIAAQLAPLFFTAKKTKLSEITKLATAVLKEMETVQPSVVATPAPAPQPKAEEKLPEPAQTSGDDLEEELEEDEDDLLF